MMTTHFTVKLPRLSRVRFLNRKRTLEVRASGGQATPMTYTLNGKQYLVIAAGGHGKLGTKQGDSVLAFTLP
jgi:hypothetical protein